MTRVTNFGIKRTYVQAGFNGDVDMPEQSQASTSAAKLESNNAVTEDAVKNDTPTPPAKKKRKRTPKSKRDGYAAQKAAEAAKLNGGESGEGTSPAEAALAAAGEEKSDAGLATAGDSSTSAQKSLSKSAKKKQRELKRKQKFEDAREARRLKRIKQKAADTTCFVCREKGHAAKDCPTTKNAGDGDKPAKVVGICYRCGSTKHSLSRCKKPVNPEDPYPFASCFVCNGKGHLASACPQNKAKGVYPNGGCCKMCGSTAHLARDCDVRKQVTTDPTNVFGTGKEAGADEDDFHLLKRKTTEIDRDEKKEAKMKQMLDIRTGKLSGVVKAFGGVQPQPKKVVVFKG